MSGFVLILVIGKYFYQLAQDYGKRTWVFAILGIVMFYVAGFIFAIVLGLIDLLFDLNINWDNARGVNLLSIPIGILADYIFYKFLEKKWKKEVVLPQDKIDQIGTQD
ncbi:MAG: hypothetical protein HRT67_00585 [Flavobacteriaceae bacterium]|nr:hypothetical protein [Flavobacteriaceae bacterium]